MFNLVFDRFYLDESEDGNDKVKWKSLPIYHLKTVYRKLQLADILDGEIDVRNTPVEELSVVQLRAECVERGLSDKGIKVKNNKITYKQAIISVVQNCFIDAFGSFDLSFSVSLPFSVSVHVH